MSATAFAQYLRSSVCRAFFLIIVTASLSASAGSLWVAESNGLLRLDPLDGAVLLEIPEAPYGTGAVAVDPSNGNVWTWGDKRLRGFDRDAELFLDIESASYPEWESPADLVVDGNAGNIWLNLGKNLYRLNLSGQVVGSLIDYGAGPTCDSMTLDRERSRLWLCSYYSVTAYDANFQVALSLALDPNDSACRTAWDNSLDELWVAVNDKLRRYDATGQMTFEMANPAGLTNTFFLKPDGKGGIWLGTETQFVYIDPTGAVGAWITPFSDFTEPAWAQFVREAVVHPADASVWIANEMLLRRYSTAGAELAERSLEFPDQIGRYLQNMDVFEDLTPPTLAFAAPQDESSTNVVQPPVRLNYLDAGSGIDVDSLALTRNGSAWAVTCTKTATSAECIPNVALANGVHDITAVVSDNAGNESEEATLRFTVDTVLPVITVSSPAEGASVGDPDITITGSVNEIATLTVDGQAGALNASNQFSHPATLSTGLNTFALVATDLAGNQGTLSLHVTLSTDIPSPPNIGLIQIADPGTGTVTVVGSAGTVEPNRLVRLTNTRTGVSVVVSADAQGAFTGQIEGLPTDQIQVRAENGAGAQSPPGTVNVPGQALPPSPSSTATALSTTGATPFAESIAFLYTGANPIQTGVAAGTIHPEFAAVVRGSVTTRAGQPLANVVVSVKDHTEYGQTRTRADGRFDLAVNGGGVLTLDYQRNGYMPLHRYIDIPHQDYVLAHNVVMIPVDTAVTEIALDTTTFQAHQSSVTTDLDGDRRITLMVPPGTTATMTLANGSTQPLSTAIRVRATEYTVGVNGIEAMPAPLPPTSAYTYAVELSVDEAIAAGARRVDFNQPLPVYLENFLNFPVGGDVPVGYYDRGPGAWIPSENGRIVRIIGIASGLAVLDVDGSNQAAEPQELATLGITSAERQRLASLYPVGASFWRFRVTHFSPWDCNWPWGDLPADASAPPDFQTPPDDPDDDETPECSGCTIEAHTQTLGESIAITGSPYSLNYRSDRARSLNRIEFPVTGSTIPPSLGVVIVTVSVAGRDIYNEILGADYTPARALPTPNQVVSVQWDGRDAYGRRVIGKTQAMVRVSYGYTPSYLTPTGLRAFGVASSTGTTISLYRNGVGGNSVIPRFIFVERTKFLTVRAQNPAIAQMGGWTFDVHHSLDVGGKDGMVLYQGNGSRRNLNIESPVIAPMVAVTGERIEGVTSGFGGSPLMARSSGRLSFGSLVIAGGGTGTPADGMLATQAAFPPIMDVTAPDTAQYFVTGNQVWRRGFNGLLTRIAGTGASGSSGDGGPARDATFAGPASIALAPDGALYVAETLGHRIRRISADGTITTYAGTGIPGFAGDGSLASSAQFRNPRGLALTKDGSLIVADEGNRRVRRIEPSGLVTTIAGNGAACADPESLCGDGSAATDALLTAPRDVAVYPNGDVGIADAGTFRVRAVKSNGTIVTVAGTGRAWTVTPQGDFGPAALSELSNEISLAVSARGETFIGDRDRLRSIARPRPGQDAAGFSLPSEEGATLYRFDPYGRHLNSVDTLTGVEVTRFGYDSVGRLTTITDRSGNSTTIERNASGVPTGVVSPDGQRTVLILNASGFLESVQDPAGNAIRLQYSSNGLLTRYTDARNNVSTYEFDARGRLTREISPGDSGWQIARTQNQDGAVVSMSSGEGRISVFTSSESLVGQRTLASRAPDGVTSTLTVATSGAEEQTSGDGTRTAVSYGPDPRFRMQAPVPTNTFIRLPSGLTRSSTATRAVTLSNSSDPLSVVQATEISTLNGREWRSVFTSATRQLITTSPEGRASQFTLDNAGRLTEISIPGLEPTRVTYDARGRLATFEAGSGTGLRRASLAYIPSGSSAGLPESITDAVGRVSQFQYDAAGRVTQQTLPGNRQVLFTYDANGNLTSITPPGRTPHVFNYTALNQTSNYAPPAAGLPTPATTYAYNRDRQLTLVTRPDAQQLSLSYGADGKLESLTTPRGVTAYSYSSTTGQLMGIADPGGVTLGYGFDGALLTSTNWSGVVNGSVALTYNNDLLVSGVNVNGQSISASYDGDSLLTAAGALGIIRDPENGLERETLLGIVTTATNQSGFGELDGFEATRPTVSQNDIANQIRAEITQLGAYLNSIWSICGFGFARTDFNNLVTAAQGLPSNTATYDPAFSTFRSRYQSSLRPNALFECSPEGAAFVPQADASIASLDTLRDDLDESGDGEPDVVYSTQYQRDRLGRITQKTEEILGTASVFEYSYDAAGRLQQVQTDGVVTESYSFDANGNRLTANGVSATYDDQDRLLSFGNLSFTYSANGELRTRSAGSQVTTYDYDVLGNLMSVQLSDGRTIGYVVDGQNRRVGKRVSGTLVQGFLYQSQLQIAAELDGSGALVSRFVYGTKPNVPDYMIRDGVSYRIISDHLGSPRLVINTTTGEIAQRIDYDAFGNIVTDTNPGFQPFGFAGGLYDRDTALIRFGARDYDPEVGRWTTKDPILFDAGDSSLYAYVGNDPIGWIDPTGLFGYDTLAALAEISHSPVSLLARATPVIGAFAIGFGVGSMINFYCGGNCLGNFGIWIYDRTHPDWSDSYGDSTCHAP